MKNRFGSQVYYARGFTLIEVTIALVILSMTLSSAMYAVHQYADERIRMKDRILANQVAWNNLMNRYQHFKGWTSGRDRTMLKTKGIDEGCRTSICGWMYRVADHFAIDREGKLQMFLCFVIPIYLVHFCSSNIIYHLSLFLFRTSL